MGVSQHHRLRLQDRRAPTPLRCRLFACATTAAVVLFFHPTVSALYERMPLGAGVAVAPTRRSSRRRPHPPADAAVPPPQLPLGGAGPHREESSDAASAAPTLASSRQPKQQPRPPPSPPSSSPTRASPTAFPTTMPTVPDVAPWTAADLEPLQAAARCAHDVGAAGRWVQDPAYAASHQYHVRGREGEGDSEFFKPTAEQPYRPATAWRWEPEAAATTPDCALRTLTRRKLCAALDALDIERVFFLGDSLTFMQVQSLWKLLLLEGSVVETGVPHEIGARRWIPCPSPRNRTHRVLLRFVWNDHITPESSRRSNLCVTRVPSERNDRCQAWNDEFRDGATPTLLVVNTGLHTHSVELFRDDLDRFARFMGRDSVRAAPQRAKDVHFFRTSVPGHEHCQKYTAPLRSREELESTSKYAWNRVPTFNAYMRNLTKTAARTASRSGGASGPSASAPRRTRTAAAPVPVPLPVPRLRMRILDVVPMTELRPDGHAHLKLDDCLHYYLPGPPDWWNHLLLHELARVAFASEKEGERRRDREKG